MNMENRETLTSTDYSPRPMSPEDRSYRDVMMLYSDHPVKPKYWFEDFGDYWSCSCGQINRDETCSNCGLDRSILKKLFESGHEEEIEIAEDSPNHQEIDDIPTEDEVDAADEESYDQGTDSTEYNRKKRRTMRIMAILTLSIVFLGGGLAAFYFYGIPELDRRDQANSEAVKEGLINSLPATVNPIHESQFGMLRNAGDAKYRDKQYEKSIEYYMSALEIRSDDSVRQKILDAKYSYVSAHQEEGGKLFKEYLGDLKKANYPGAENIYERTYAWKASIVANTGSGDFSTDMASINRVNTVYFHATLSGGPPNEELDLYYEILWPDGTSEKKAISASKSSGETVTTQCSYTFPPSPNESKLTYKLYNNADHNILATDSVTLI